MSRPLAIARAELPPGIVAIPVRTPLVHPGEDFVTMIAEAVNGIARAGDVIAVSETAVAIAQGQAVSAEYVRPSRLAYFLSKRAGAMATVNQPESLQIVIDQVGQPRVIFAALMHVLGRFIGQRGLFYRVMGEAVTAIDGYTGTLPPFGNAIVLSPQNPDAYCESIKERTGADAAIVDANDLEKAKVLGASHAVNRRHVECALLSNPHGNSDEQTPLVVLKWRGTGANPLFEMQK